MSGPSGNWRSSVGLYSATGLKSLTPTDTDGADDWNGTGFDGFVTTNVSVLAGGFLVSSLLDTGSGVAPSSSWVGATQDFINTIQGSYAGASLVSTTTHAATVTGAFGGQVGLVGATASFR
jgi:hypothetical protein